MKAITIDQFGPADNFTKTDIAEPAIVHPDEVKVKIHAFSVNPMDIAARAGMLNAPFSDNWSFPLDLGWDFAGTITALGDDVDNFVIGDSVFGSLPSDHAGNSGSYGEFTTVPVNQIAKKPTELSFDEAAALPIAGGTAYQAITEGLNIQPESKVLIQGGSGGVGFFAVQIAKAVGATVITTTGPDHIDLLKQTGADIIVDYHQSTVLKAAGQVDVVFDTVGDLDGGLAALKPGGKLITVAAQPTPDQQAHAADQDQTVAFQFTHSSTQTFENLAKLVLDGKLRIEFQVSSFTADNVIAAHKEIEGRHTTGKLVIHVTD